jgi:hypothetical protein
MANQLSGQTGPSPRCHRNHERHDHFARVRHSPQFKAFLAAQATRLSSTSAVVFARVEKYGADRVRTAVNLAAIP